MDILRGLHLPDYLSLTAVFWAWISIVVILIGNPNWAIIMSLIAFAFDVMDGYFARTLNLESSLGRQIDSYGDVFTYLVFSALFFYKFISPNLAISLTVGFLVLLFGGLRLIRFNNEGMLEDRGKKYYRGLIVTYVWLITIASYFFGKFVGQWSHWYTTFLLIIVSPLMLGNFKNYKIKSSTPPFLVICLFLLLSLYLEYGYKK